MIDGPGFALVLAAFFVVAWFLSLCWQLDNLKARVEKLEDALLRGEGKHA